jgi:hypothetical protein
MHEVNFLAAAAQATDHDCLRAAQTPGVDYGALFRGTETLFRFYSPKQVVSAGRFKEGG